MTELKQRLSSIKIKREDISLLFYPASILLFELILGISAFKSIASIGFTIFTSITVGLFLFIITNFFKPKLAIARCLVIFLAFVYGMQIVYYEIFGTFFTLSSLTMAGDVMQYWTIGIKALFTKFVYIILLFVPFISLFFVKFDFKEFTRKNTAILAAIAFVIYLIPTILVNTGFIVGEDNKKLYQNNYIPSLAVEHFGLVLSTNADINHLLGFVPEVDILDTIVIPPIEIIEPEIEIEEATTPATYLETDVDIEVEPEPEPIVYEPHVLDIDLAALAESEEDETIAMLHSYFNSITPQSENEYTGMFEGYNLIFITAESFDKYVIDPELTPNLYRLYSEGFQFDNFYTPGWSVSTTDGEYVAMTSLIPKSGVRSFAASYENYLPFTMGMQTTANGYYPIVAYHNHTYNYYSRELSHPNMGYDYKALGMGLDVKATWPESDLEMMELSVDEYINSDTPFHAYYMTVSGHQLYSFVGNSMSIKNKAATDDLEYSEAVRAYISAHIELDNAIGYILDALEEAGKLETTVIALSADHYPYGLTLEELGEMSGKTMDDTFSKYENSFLLWSGSMEEPIVVDKLSQSLDIIPTLSNLLGFEYDSRLLMGNDILGDDYMPLVIFSDRSFISEYGMYNYSEGTFSQFDENVVLPDNYVSSCRAIIDNKFEVSKLILESDYYSFLKEDE